MGEGGALPFRGIQDGVEAVLIALKATRLKRPTLTRYPFCRRQTTCQAAGGAARIDFCDHERPETYESVIRAI